MIITLPRHVAQSADLSARARIPAISRLLVSAALFFARFEEYFDKPIREGDISDHMARDIGLDRMNQHSGRIGTSGQFPGY